MGKTTIEPNLLPHYVAVCKDVKTDFLKNLQLDEKVLVRNGESIRLVLSQNCKYAVIDKKGKVEPLTDNNIINARINAKKITIRKNLSTFPAVLPKSARPYGDKPPVLKLP